MKSVAFSFPCDAKMIPPVRNLSLRNGVFYFRCMINGKRIYRSLNTSDPYLARYLLKIALIEIKRVSWANCKDCFSKLDQSLVHTEKLNALNEIKFVHSASCDGINNLGKKIITKEVEDMPRKKKHEIMKVWNNEVKHKFQHARDYNTATLRLERAVSFMGIINVEDLEKQPQVLDIMFEKLSQYIQPKGKNKGLGLSKQVIRDTVNYIKQVVEKAEEKQYIHKTNEIYRKLSLKKYVYANWEFKAAIKREAVAEDDFKIIFEALYKLHKHDLSFVEAAIQNKLAESKVLNRIIEHPDIIFYAVLIALFSGSRANATITLRHSDIDIVKKTISIHKDKNDKVGRDQYKALKTDVSERDLPIPEILVELGFLDYLSRHEQQFGTDAFIFEEAIVNQSGTGYRTKNINEAVNALWKILGIKPAKDSKEILDMHSLKTSFYSLNAEVLSTNMLEALAGNAPSGKGQSAKTYTKLSMKRTKTQFVFSMNQIRFPHIEELFGGSLMMPKHLRYLTTLTDRSEDFKNKPDPFGMSTAKKPINWDLSNTNESVEQWKKKAEQNRMQEMFKSMQRNGSVIMFPYKS